MSGWKLINTAPMDGSRVMLFRGGRYGVSVIAGWDHEMQGWCIASHIIFHSPTHWQPQLPSPYEDETK